MLAALKSRLPSPPRRLFLLAAAAALAVVAVTYYRVWSPKYGITRLIQIGTELDRRGIPVYRATPKYMDPYPPDRWGFDGQYYAELSLDPLLRDPGITVALDDPAYRARRILLPWIAHALGFGHPFLTLNLYAALNPLFWLVYVVLLYRLFRGHGWYGFGGFCAMLLTCGVIECMKGSLTDFPAFVFMTGALMTGGWAGAALLALAGLTREVSVLATPALFRYRPPWGRTILRNIGLGLVVGVPMALWWAYLWWRLHIRTHGDTDNIDWPLVAMNRKFWEVVALARNGGIRWTQFYKSEPVHAILTIVAVLTQSVYLLTHRRWENRIWRVGALFIPFFLCIGYAQWESHFTITRQALPITLAFNLILALSPERRRWIWYVLGNAFVPYGILLLISVGRQVPRLPELNVAGQSISDPIVSLRYDRGWSVAEWNTLKAWRWSVSPQADLILRNAGSKPVEVEIDFTTTSIAHRDLRVTERGNLIWLGQLNRDVQRYQPVRTLPFALPPGETRIDFTTTQPLAQASPEDKRNVGFMLSDCQVTVLPPAP